MNKAITKIGSVKRCFRELMTLLWVGFFVLMSCGSTSAAEQLSVSADAIISASTPVAISFMLSILTLKITAFVLGYLIVKLGHDTLIKGVTGQIDFGITGSGFNAKLKAASPGALFVLMGASIIIWGLTVQKPMSISAEPKRDQQVVSAPTQSSENHRRPQVPD